MGHYSHNNLWYGPLNRDQILTQDREILSLAHAQNN